MAQGFRLFEACNGLRWTDGYATVPAEFFQGLAGPMELVLRVGATTQYPLLMKNVVRSVA